METDACLLFFQNLKRPSELQRKIPNADRRVMDKQLQGLVLHAFINKKAFDTKVPKVEYELTELGQKLFPEFFGQKYLNNICDNIFSWIKPRISRSYFNFYDSTEAIRFSIANILRGSCEKKSFRVSVIRDYKPSAKIFQALINVVSYCFQAIDCSFPRACLNGNLHRKVSNLTNANAVLIL